MGESWSEGADSSFTSSPANEDRWWSVLGDPALEQLIERALRYNNNLQTAGLRVLEAQAQLAIARGNRWPQSQALSGGASWIEASSSNANTQFGDLDFAQYELGGAIAWELDFWGRYRRSIESADAGYLATVAAYDNFVVLLAALVAETYTVIRTLEAQLQVAKENVALQRQSFDMTDALFRNGEQSELDVLQARTLLLSTEAAIPELETALAQAQHAMSVLLGMSPGELRALIPDASAIPTVPESLAVGIPANVLRQRPDVRQAEQQARALNAQVGVAQANLRPSFSLTGSLGVSAADNTSTTGSGDSGLDAIFSSDSVTYAAGPRFVWPLFNYGRLRNNVLVQDARLQQALVQYRETVLQASREVEDALVGFTGSRRQDAVLTETVEVARRSAQLSVVRYREGFADYQRVLNSQQALFNQQLRLIGNKGAVVRSLIALYRALGGGWQTQVGQPLIDDALRSQMRERVNWGERLQQAPQR